MLMQTFRVDSSRKGFLELYNSSEKVRSLSCCTKLHKYQTFLFTKFYLVFVGRGDVITYLNLENLNIEDRLRDHKYMSTIISIDISQDDRYLLSCDKTGILKVWEFRLGKCIATFKFRTDNGLRKRWKTSKNTQKVLGYVSIIFKKDFTISAKFTSDNEVINISDKYYLIWNTGEIYSC